MSEPNTAESALDLRFSRKRIMTLYLIGLLLFYFGVIFTTMTVMNHLKASPRQPLSIDLTLRTGYGGFMFYGTILALLGFAVIVKSTRLRKAASLGIGRSGREDGT